MILWVGLSCIKSRVRRCCLAAALLPVAAQRCPCAARAADQMEHKNMVMIA